MVPLWKINPNVRVMQAASHADLLILVEDERYCFKSEVDSFFSHGDFFEKSRSWAKASTKAYVTRIAGCRLDNVRTLLANWIIHYFWNKSRRIEYVIFCMGTAHKL